MGFPGAFCLVCCGMCCLLVSLPRCHQLLLPLPGNSIRGLQHRVQQPCRLLLAGVLRMAVGALEKRGVRVTQQIGGHLFAGPVFQQIGGDEVPHCVQVVVFGEAVAVIQPAQVAAERIRVDGLSLFGENQVIRADAIVFHNLVEK